jgi:hypothetical protein
MQHWGERHGTKSILDTATEWACVLAGGLLVACQVVVLLS